MECDNGAPGHYPMAIVEHEDGEVRGVPLDAIRFEEM